MRPLFLEFPELTQPPGSVDHEFLFGGALLVAPQAIATEDAYQVVLPRGDWYDYASGRQVDRGQPLRVTPHLDVLPIYVRGGSIFAQQAAVRSTAETPAGPLELAVYPPGQGSDCSGSLYWDDGRTFAFQHGDYLRDRYACELRGSSLTVTIAAREGRFLPWWREIDVAIHGAPHAARRVLVNGVSQPSAWDAQRGVVHVRVADTPAGSLIRVDY
jgi:alpha-glucosidase